MTDDTKPINDTGEIGRRSRRPSWLAMIGIVLLVATVAGAIFWFVAEQSASSKGSKLQNNMQATYASAAAKLAECKKKAVQSANVAQAHSKVVGDIYAQAIAGTTTDGKPATRENMLLLLRQVNPYPDTSQISKSYDYVMATINGCQSDFTAWQRRVQLEVKTFRDWRYGTWAGRTFGGDFPNNQLVINLPGVPVETGQAALLKMGRPIITTDTARTYQSGLDDETGPFPGPGTNNAPTGPATTPSPTPTK